jgi:hypothetical protein
MQDTVQGLKIEHLCVRYKREGRKRVVEKKRNIKEEERGEIEKKYTVIPFFSLKQ